MRDLDVFCRAGDYPRILCYLREVAGIGFAGAKGFAGGFCARMLSPFREPAIKQFGAEGVEEAIRLEPALRALGAEAQGGPSDLWRRCSWPSRQTLPDLTINAPRQVTR